MARLHAFSQYVKNVYKKNVHNLIPVPDIGKAS